MLLTLSLAAWSASWTAEDLVAGVRRGLPASTLSTMAESVGGGSDTAVYLLRRGLTPEAVRALGYPVDDAEGFGAERLGPLAERPSDTDRYELLELPAALDAAFELEPFRADKQAHARRRGAQVAVGVGLTALVFGGVGFIGGMSGPPTSGCTVSDDWSDSKQLTDLIRSVSCPEINAEPDLPFMAVSALAMAAGGVTVTFALGPLRPDRFDRRQLPRGPPDDVAHRAGTREVVRPPAPTPIPLARGQYEHKDEESPP